MAKDFPLLWKVYDYIVDHPNEWCQSQFVAPKACGTTFCFAGHTVMMARPDMTLNGHFQFVDSDGVPVNPEDEGARLLGLREWEKDALFYNFTNDPGDIRNVIATWEAEELLGS